MVSSAKGTESNSSNIQKGYKVYIMAYNRAPSLQRLLESLQSLKSLDVKIDIVISLDKGFLKEVKKVGEEMDWTIGQVTLFEQEEHLGLNEHVFKIFEMAGDNDNDQNVIFLEDDTMALDGLDKLISYQIEILNQDRTLFCSSFYNYYRNEELGIPFIPLQTGSPVFAMQKISSRGWMTTSYRVKEFLLWKDSFKGDFSNLPPYMLKWERNAWEKWVNSYLIRNNLFCLYPYFSATTGFGEIGDHYRSEVHRFLAQTPFHPLTHLDFNVVTSPDQLLRYDAFYEISSAYLKSQTNETIDLPDNFDVDLYGTKRKSDLVYDFVLTSRFKQREAYSISFGMDLLPIEQNILMNNSGDELRLTISAALPIQNRRQHYRQRYKFRLHSHTYQTIMDGIRMKIARWFF